MAEREGALAVLADAAQAHLEPFEKSYQLCAYCPKMCRFACPVSEADSREALTPWGKMSAAFLVTKGALPLATAFDTSWACTGCGHCVDYCAHGNDVPLALAALRAAGIAAGLAPPDGLKGRSAPAAAQERADDGKSPVLFLPGCSGPVSSTRMQSAAAIVEKLGGQGVTLAKDPRLCCGSELWWRGRPDLFDDHARAFAAKMARRKVLVTADAGCAWTLKVLYRERGIRLKPQVLHASEWLASFFKERVLKARQKKKGVFLYQDPCLLARPLGVIDAPRAVLSAILLDGAREFAWNGREALCCGGAGLLPRTMPETAGRMADRRGEEAAAQRATIVTACPTCEHSLTGHGAPVTDLLTLVADSL